MFPEQLQLISEKNTSSWVGRERHTLQSSQLAMNEEKLCNLAQVLP